MVTFAVVREPDQGNPTCECAHNRDIELEVDPSLTYFVMSDDVNEKYGIDYDDGEMLIYSPDFGHPDHGDDRCLWVAQTIDFDFHGLDEVKL
jgi:hypothetical protein